MDHKRWKKINDIVDFALDMSEEFRLEYIQNRCENDKKLMDEVIRYLKSIDESGNEGFLERPSQSINYLAKDISEQDENSSVTSFIGKAIGKYRVLSIIEHGGMGTVFMAERTDDVYQKKVAIKLLRSGMDTPENLARFNRERNILANLDHPNITNLMDGGVTERGLPYLVMDYIDGTPLLEYCDQKKLSVDERLEIFKIICEAVRHAHRNAVIHRDLKPSNILITCGGKVKVLDFGIAKLMNSSDSDWNESQNRSDSNMLTLKYAAPEQITSESITTATDVYSLGVLLYELLAGVYPVDLEGRKIWEIEEIICDVMPEPPSRRLNELSRKKLNKVAKNRQTKREDLLQELSFELNAIIIKALQKNPGNRYSSIDKLLNDFNRLSKSEPISAVDDSVFYRSSKFIRRNKNKLIVAAVFILILSGVLTFHTVQITEERNIAIQEEKRADEAISFLLNLYNTEAGNDTLSVAGLLQEGKAQLQDIDSESAKLDLFTLMGRAYKKFGDYEQAEVLLQQAVNKNMEMYGEESLEYASALYHMGDLQSSQYQWKEAVNSFHESYKIMFDELGEQHIRTASALTHFAMSLRNTGALDEAERYSSKAVTILERIYEPGNRELITAEAGLAYVLRQLEKFDKAETIYLQVINRAENSSAVPDTDLATYYNNLGYLYRKQQKYDLAIEQFNKAVQLLEQHFTVGHPEVINTRKNLATSYYFNGQPLQTESLLKKNADAIRKKHSTNHWRTASALNSLGVFYLETGKLKDSEPYLRESTQINRIDLGPAHLWTAYSEGLLAASLKFQGEDIKESDSLFQHHLQVYKKNRSDLDRNNRNHLRKLRDIYKINSEDHTIALAYEELLDR